MKKIILLAIICAIAANSIGQTETFDLATFKAPKGWKKEAAESAIQFSNEDAAKGTYCLITLYKAVQGTANSKANFDLSWEGLVKEMVAVSGAPEMEPVTSQNGWEVQSGYAVFENEGNKGIVLLVTASSLDRMVNLSVLTNTDVYEKTVTGFLESISLKKLDSLASKQVTNPDKSKTPHTTAKQDGFAFNTSNFDNGWTSTVQEDWVQVTKGNIKVLIHYPNRQVDVYNSQLLDGLQNAWNVLLAPRYSSASNLQFKPLSGWQPIEFAEADMVENMTGKKVYVVLFKKNYSGNGGRYLEFITPDKAAFEKEFGQYINEASSNWWDKLAGMANYNKFAVAASDLKGKWTSNFTGMTQYVNAYTGASAGADTHASNESFEFGAGNTYKWDLAVASGFIGNIKFQGVKSKGKFSMINNWEVHFTDIEGKPKTYNVQFTCIKGARILWIGSTGFGKKE